MNGSLTIRQAVMADLSKVVQLLSDDRLGSAREVASSNDLNSYEEAMRAILEDKHNHIFVAEKDSELVACFQLTQIQCLTYKGGKRLQVEGVRVSSTMRGHGVGKEIFAWIKDYASKNNCHLIQLTTDRKRPEALKFYESLGYINSHNGMKLHLQ